MLGTIARIPMTNPFVFGVVFSTFKTSFSDWVVQRFVERRKEIDWRRNGTFAAFGCFYLGGVQYMIYVPFFQRIFPTAKAFTELPFAKKMTDFAGQRTVAYQVFIDQFVHHPLLYFPFFYTLKELVNGGPIDGGIKKCIDAQFRAIPRNSWRKYSDTVAIPPQVHDQLQRGPRGAVEAVGAVDVPQLCADADVGAHPVGRHHLAAVDLHPLGDARRRGHVRGARGARGGHHAEPRPRARRVLSNMESDYDRTQAHIVINAAGPDRVGYVHALASAMTSTGGNLIESKMMRLGRRRPPAAGRRALSGRNSCAQFADARAPRARCRRRLHRDDADKLRPPEKKRAITKALPKVEGMNITVRETTPWEESGHAAGRPEAVRAERFRANLLVAAPTSRGCSRRSPACARSTRSTSRS